MNDTQVLPTIRLNPGSKASDFQTANATLRNLGGGFIELTPGAAYVMDAGFILDVGAGVGLKGNNAVFDFRSLSTGVCINLNARARNPDNFPVAGYDGAVGNYHSNRSVVGNFSMIGPGKTVSAITAIDIDQSTGTDGTRSPRPHLQNLAVEGFGVGIKHRNRAYAVYGNRVSVFRCGTCLSIEAGTDSGENSLFDNCFFFNSNLAVDFNTSTDDVAMTFRNCSFDYNVQQLKHTSGYGRTHFYECHFEHNDESTAYPIDFSAGAGATDRAIYRFDGGVFVHTSANKNFPAYFNIGQNIRVVFTGSPQLHSVNGLGVVRGVGKGAAGADITYVYFAYCSNAAGSFELDGSATNGYQLANRGLPPLLTNSLKSCLTGDPSFELTSVVDGWYDVSTTPGSTIGTIATATTDFLSGSRSLQVPIIGGSGTNRKLALFVPIEKLKGRDFSYMFSTKASAGTGSYYLDILPCIARKTSATTVTIDYTGTAILASAATMTGTDWQRHYLNSMAARLTCPEWATHIQFRFNLDSVSNSAGNLFFDDFFVTAY